MEYIEIIASNKLSEMHLGSLEGRRGVIVMPNEHHTGYFVKLDEPFMIFEEWFIPNESIKRL